MLNTAVSTTSSRAHVQGSRYARSYPRCVRVHAGATPLILPGTEIQLGTAKLPRCVFHWVLMGIVVDSSVSAHTVFARGCGRMHHITVGTIGSHGVKSRTTGCMDDLTEAKHGPEQ